MRRLQPLRRWLSLQFALVASIPLVVVAGLVWIFLLPQMRADIAVRHQALAGAIAGRVSAHLLGADHALRALADYINTQGPQLGQSWIPLLDAEAGTGDMFEAIYIADENRAVYAVGLPEMRRGNREDLIGLDLSRRDFIGDAPILKREVWSETFLSTVSSRLAVALAIPMGYRVMVGEITIERLSQFIRQLPVEQGLFTTIVDRQGRIIADSRPGFSGRQVDAGILGMVQDRSQAQGSPTTFEMDGRILMGTTVAVEQGGWKVLVAQPYADAFRTMTATLRMVATGLAISLLLAVTVGWLQARSLSRHIRRYTRQAQAIASGDYDQPWPESRTLEFSGLVRDLQLMSDAIRQREKAITAGRERYRTLFETMVQGVIYVDAEGRITTANPAAEMILGLGLEQVKGRSLLDLPWQVISEDGASLASDAMPVVVALRTGRAVRDVVIGLSNPDTRTVTWVSVNAIPLFQPGKELPFQVYATLADITERKRAEEALRLSEDNLRITLDSIGDAVIATDINGVITRLNPIAEHLTGWSAAEAIDRPLVEVFHVVNAYTRQRVESPVEKVLAEGQIVGLANHTVLIAKDGTEYQIADSGAPIRRADGEIVGVVLVFRDVTEAHAQAQKISESEYVLRGITTNLPGVVYQFRASADHQYSLQHYSEKANEIFGLDVPVEEFFAAIAARIPDGEKERFYASIQAAVEQEIPWDYEGRYIKPNGDTMWFQGNSIPHRKGDDILFDGILLDITERKLAENELRRLRNYLANIIDSMPSVLVGVDGEGRVTQWNRHAQVTTGMDAEAVLGKPLEAAYPLLSSKMDKIRETIRSGNVHREQKVQRHDFQEIRYEDVIIYPLITNGVEGAVIRVDDVTERVRLEEMMVQSEKMLSVGGLAAGMAHEINNPLAGLMQSAMVLENRLGSDLEANRKAAAAVGTNMETIRAYMESRGLKELLSNIRESGSRAARIVRNMLEFARKSDRAFSSHHLGQVMDQTIELAASDYDLKKNYDFKRIQIVRDYSTNLQEVPCEKTKIQQVLLNILKNGAQSMANQGTCDGQPPRFILRTRRDGNMARMEIEDNGPGMDEATRRRVFEPFFTTKPVDQGTGLGLSVSYFIVTEDHGGTMTVSSVEGKGTVFIIRLPLEGRERP